MIQVVKRSCCKEEDEPIPLGVEKEAVHTDSVRSKEEIEVTVVGEQEQQSKSK